MTLLHLSVIAAMITEKCTQTFQYNSSTACFAESNPLFLIYSFQRPSATLHFNCIKCSIFRGGALSSVPFLFLCLSETRHFEHDRPRWVATGKKTVPYMLYTQPQPSPPHISASDPGASELH